MFEIAEKLKLPILLIAEGGGGRPGDTDGAGIAGLDCLAFQLYAEMSGPAAHRHHDRSLFCGQRRPTSLQ